MGVTELIRLHVAVRDPVAAGTIAVRNSAQHRHSVALSPLGQGDPWYMFRQWRLPTITGLGGVLGATALVVTGQLVCSVLLDHFGWLGFTEHAAGIGRIVGCLLMLAGFFLIARC